ncbi:hypothetical protein [Desulfofustis limnaeus]|jgi:hypothetical protein|uniref:Uncharacterized protein n=1 Tax=Desulfofustis limnaeus TaxID=2740163 RepID=A0ABM7W6B3_9BACT|nr:hypothetical protein [Desulfofustis limnaeus]MDX9896294.1 hypothetical protein [Desulfofustis sp.]BDD86477.1 hypothetical protein DPPLL_08420 [Desulfofustis limnaeus]
MSGQESSPEMQQGLLGAELSFRTRGDRRAPGDRRVNGERRYDPRGGIARKRSLKAWVRSLTNPRIGVDRRKGEDRRKVEPQKSIGVKTLLTQQELDELSR